jgi:RHS repeat-associated protein
MLKLHYAYDSVSNITDVVNQAPQLSNGLGGDYDNSYGYDNLYRLSSAEGHWYGVSPLSYNLSMSYFDNGRICKKVLTAGTLLNGNFSAVSYGRYYHYNTTSQQNTIIGIDGSEIHGFQWDATGNLIYHRFDRIPGERFLCWDEANRLQGVRDDEYLSFYQYDANGERTYKLTGKPSRQNVSGRWSATYVLDNPTLYPSPYMVVTPKGYTKHYYVENERIASRIGGGGIIEIDSPIVRRKDVKKKVLDLNSPHLKKVLDCLQRPEVYLKNTLEDIYRYKDIVEHEDEGYWYHPDHLGSSSWITNIKGDAIQHLHYLPWGEDFVDQRSTNWNAMYTFSAKEKDTETGYSYFGARYYSSDLSIWLSVDPMSDKYPSLSPYVYCANNPIKLVDPNGEEVYIFGKNRHRNTIIRSLNKHFENITIGYNKKSGQLYIEKGTALTNDEIALADAISDKKIEVNIQLSKSSTLDYKNSKGETLKVDGAGAFLGNTIFYDGKGKRTENIRKVRTQQHISMEGLAKYYKKKNWGALANHEITESYQGGVISSTENVPGTSEQGLINKDIFNRAHEAATSQPTPKKYKE